MAAIKISDEKNKYLNEIYYNLEKHSSFSGINALLNKIKKDGKHKISRKQLEHWLSSQETYTSYKPVKRRFRRRKIIAISKNHIWEMDCAYMNKYKKYNDNYAFFLLAIDVLTRYVHTVPLKTLQGREMVTALKKIMTKFQPQKVRVDGGVEFNNKLVKEYLSSKNIKLYKSYNEVKAALAERGIKSVKSRLLKYMHRNKSKKWVTALKKITINHNNSYNRMIKLSPSEAITKPNHELYYDQYFTGVFTKTKKYKFNINDKVKISKLKTSFERAYDEKWSKEVFIVADRWKAANLNIYKIKSLTNDTIEGSFYQEELQLISLRDDSLYIIEKIIKTRIKNNKEQSLIKWLGYDESESSWVDTDQIESV